jgi:hypothetical protein
MAPEPGAARLGQFPENSARASSAHPRADRVALHQRLPAAVGRPADHDDRG